MKKMRTGFRFIALCLFFTFVFVFSNSNNIAAASNSQKLSCEVATGNLLDDANYVNYYKIPLSLFSEYTAGGSNTNLERAFDGNWNTFWQTQKENSATFKNDITVTFKEPVTIDRILYASSSARHGHGYPVILKIYTALDGELELYDTVVSTATNNRVVFKFDVPQTVQKIKFEFDKVNPAHNWTATAKELQFLMPESEAVESIRTSSIFMNYSQTELTEEYKNPEKIKEIRRQVEGYPSYETSFKQILDRAEAVANGLVKFDVRREFSTADDSPNKINQWGNMRNYARDVLKMNSFGINRQVTGIAGMAGEKIVIYVDGNENDPLPKVAFTQTHGAWQSWKREVQLKLGRNELTFPNLKTNHYKTGIAAGGAIHLINPYTPEQQSGNVKVYIENGSFYPVFRSGDDENTFRLYLEDYYKKLNDPNDDTVKCDVFEVVTDHIMLSTLATHAYDTYITKNISPQSNCDKWEDFMRMLLKFGGVALDPGDEYYDERNQHIYANIRICQPSPGYYAFAADDHIGILDTGTYGALVNKGATGWAFSHELGHTFDNRERIWGEVTNNMWAYFDVMHDGLYDRLPLRNVVNQLASDITLTKTSFMSFGDNCVFWMAIEGAFPGYWGKLENLYRFEPTGKSLGRTERMVYYSSLATGTNLFEYFERFGFYMNGDSAYTANNRFRADRASEQLNNLMDEAISSGRISKSGKKIWYVDTKQFSLLIKNNHTLGSWANCYSQSDEIDILEIAKAGQNYSLNLPAPTNATAHLGYEVSSFIDGEWKVVGFTYTTTFVDPNVYEQAPQYRVRAFDRAFNSTGFTEKTYQEITQEAVCMLNGVYYNSISEAVSKASAGDTIYLVKNVEESGIVIDKSLTICPHDSVLTDVSILRSGSADIFTVNQGVTFTISGRDNAKIIIDGKNLSSQGSLVRVNGVFNATGNVVFRNNNTTGNGGAISLNGTINLTNCEIYGNSASIGGAVYGNTAGTRANYNNVIFSNNNAANYGGAIYNVGNSTFNNCQFENNASGVSGGAVCNDRGGIVTLNNCSLTDNKSTNGGAIFADGRTNLNMPKVSGNSATNGGAIYASGGNSARSVQINGGSYSDNTAANSGSLIYHNKGDVYINRSSTAPNAMPSLSGEYYKANSANLTINNQWLDFSGLTFTLQSVNEGSRVFATTFNVNADQVLSVKVKDANVYLDNRIIKVSPKTVTITINFESTTLTQTVPVGYFTFPETVEGLDQRKYIINWTYNGETYNVGDRILIDKDCNFNINLGNYLTVTLIDGDQTESVYVIPNTEYYLPLYSPSGNEVCLWHSENKQIVPATHVTINSNMNFVAETFVKFTVTFKNADGSIISSNNYKYGNSVIVPKDPEGQSNEVVNVYFDGWSPNVENICKGNAEYTATFREEPVVYTVIFKDFDGKVLSTKTYGYGEMVEVPADPARAATDTHTYTFSGWDKEVETECKGDAEYVATYTEEQRTYTVTFKDYDGTVLSTKTYGYGDKIEVPADPTRPATDTHTYTFKGWDKEVETECKGNAEYVATYTEEQRTYTVTFKDYDGTVLSTKTYGYGDKIEVPADPARPATDTTRYTFNGWSPDVKTLCAGNAEYVATYAEEKILYTVTFKDYDGTVLSTKTYGYGDTVEVPADPTRAATDTHTYTFSGWDKEVETECKGNAEYVATYTEEQRTYTVTFKDYDGKVLSTKTYGYGDKIEVPADPTRPATDTHTYTFSGWDKEVEIECKGNAEYVATYFEEQRTYTVTFKDHDGTVLSTKTYGYGDTVEVPADPTRAATDTHTYTFSGWDKEVETECKGNAEYVATYTEEQRTYTVTFKDYDGKVLSTKTYGYGDTIEVPADPARPATDTHTYTFSGWDKEVETECKGNAEYVATYFEEQRTYTVTFKDHDGTVLSTKTYGYGETVEVPADPARTATDTHTYTFSGWDKEVETECKGNAEYVATYFEEQRTYTVTFKDHDGTVLSTKTYGYGDKIEVPADPTRPATDTHTYAFKGWDKEVETECKGDAEYVAIYTEEQRTYTVTFKDYDGTVLSTKTYGYGETVEVPADPARTATDTHTYTFSGWDKEVETECKGDAEYVATYAEEKILYTVTFKDYDGKVLSTKTYGYGDKIEVPADPTRPATDTTRYTFDGWSPNVENVCKGNAEYTATFREEPVVYTVIFKDYDGKVLSTKTYGYGDTVEVPADPARPATDTHTYTFSGWDKEVETECKGNAEYVATYAEEKILYTVTFKDYDGTVLSTKTYGYGDKIEVPADPTRPATDTTRYTFDGWSPNVKTLCAGNAEYVATYAEEKILYTVTFKDYDGTVLSTKTYGYGDKIEVPADPTRPATDTHTYTFKGWDKEVETECKGNAEYVATYAEEQRTYTVTFKDYDGKILSTKTYGYGDPVEVPADPTRAATDTHTYTFSGWDKEVETECKGNAEYVATYAEEKILYTVTFKDYDGTVLSTKTYGYGDKIEVPADPTRPATDTTRYTFDGWSPNVKTLCAGNAEYVATYAEEKIEPITYTVIFKDYDGKILSTKTYGYGDKIEVPADPARPATDTHTYTFKGWDKEVETECKGNAEYVATYTEEQRTYTVTFKDYDGTVLSTKTYGYGDKIEVPADPARPATDTHMYTFKGWDKEVETECKGNAEYVATYVEEKIEPITYTVIFKDYDGKILSTKTYGYGDPVEVPIDPTRPATDTTRYTFNGWSPDVKTLCAGNAEYVATYTEEKIEKVTYTVIFKDFDGTVLSTKTYGYGDTVEVPADPTRPATDTHTYTFKGWDKEVETECKGNAEYIATYVEEKIEPITYTVTFKDYDGKILSTKTYGYGDKIEVPADPTRPATDTTRYTFNGWSPDVKTLCEGNAEYVATYLAEKILYTVTSKDHDGKVLGTKTDGYGEAVKVPAEPTRPATNSHTYTFNGRDKEAETQRKGNAEYVTANTEEKIEKLTYTVIFKDHDGTVLSIKTYGYGETVKVPADPTRPATDTTRYTFNGWSPDVKALCAGNAEYVATYTAIDLIKCKITVENGSILNANGESFIFNEGDSVTIEAKKPDKGMKFVGWYVGDELVSKSAKYTFTVENGDMNFVAVYEKEAGSVTPVLPIVCCIIVVIGLAFFLVIIFKKRDRENSTMDKT